MRDQLFRELPPPPPPQLQPITPVPVAPNVRTSYHCVDTPGALEGLAADLAKVDHVVIDTETSSVDPMRAVLAGISLSTAPGEAWYVPVASEIEETGGLPGLLPPTPAPGLPLETVRRVLGGVLAAERPGKAGQNIKYDAIVLRRAGLPLGGIVFDTMIASYCLDPSRRSHGLDALAKELCGHDMISFESLFDRRVREKDIRRVPLDKVVEYACEDADFTLRIERVFRPLMDASEVRGLFRDVEMPLSELLTRMEMTGVRVDASFLDNLAEKYGARIAALEESVYASVGERFNIASTPRLREVLFDRLKLKPARRTKTGYSTDADVLESLSGQHEVVSLLLEWRQLVKLKGTYVDALPRLIHPETGRVHTSYNQAVAATGRLSSSDPNLQNIPIRTAEGREIRRAFIPREVEWVLLDADYSQIELRILAHLSGDDALQQAFRDDADVHRITAARVMKAELDAVTPEMRNRAKVVNFGIVYGMGARGLAQSLGIETAEARRFIDDYFASYPGVKRFIDDTIAAAKRDRVVTTLLGRMRRLPDIHSTNPGARAFSERVAVNTPVQGTAADIIKLAMLSVDREIRARGMRARLILQVHDELLLDVPRDELDDARHLVRECMENAIDLDVPLKVDMGEGNNWLEAHG
jgi:DNA polymerase-1